MGYSYQQGWTAQRVFWVAIPLLLLFVSSIGVPFLPLGGAMWLCMLLLAYAWPPPEHYLMDNRAAQTSRWVKEFQSLELWSGLSPVRHWRIGPQGDHQPAGSQDPQQEASRVGPVTVNSIAAAATAAVFAGMDLLVSTLLSGLHSSASLAPPWLDHPNRWQWVAVLSAAAGWVGAKAVAELQRKHADEASVVPPTALMRRVPNPAAPNAEAQPTPPPTAEALDRPPGMPPPGITELDEPIEDGADGTDDEKPAKQRAAVLRPLVWVVRLLRRRWLPPDSAGGWNRFLSVLSLLTILSCTGAAVTAAAFTAGPLKANGVDVTWVYLLGAMLVGAGIGAALSLTWFVHGHARVQREGWQEWLQTVREWQERWTKTKLPGITDRPPSLMQQIQLPKAPEDPVVRRFAFKLQAGTDFAMVEGSASRLLQDLPKGTSHVAVAPYHDKGTPKWTLFTVDINEGAYPSAAHLRGDLVSPALCLAVKAQVVEAFGALRLGCPLLLERYVRVFTGAGDQFPPSQVPEHTAPVIVHSRWFLPRKQEFDGIVAASSKLQDQLGCQWLRISRAEDKKQFDLFFGSPPSECKFDNIKKPLVQKQIQRRLAQLDWEHWFRVTGVQSGSDTPQLTASSQNKLGATCHEFDLPLGLSTERVKEATSKLRTASGAKFLEVEEGDSPTECRIFTGDVDPLDHVFHFTDYEHLLREPVKGEPDPTFVCGVGLDGDLIRYHWDDEQPHLLIAGSSGMGKSGVVNLMLVQMLHNCHPDDLHVWMMEPKNELQEFQHLEHVRVFIDQNVTSMSEYEAAAHVLEAGVDEMNERYKQFSLHPQRPQKLAEARALADADPEGAGHLKYPLLFIIIEECASYLENPSLATDRQMHGRLSHALSEIARKGRASGIHVALITQNPTKQSLPTTIKRQCRRIGLSTGGDRTASMVIIENTGLAPLTAKGRGLVKSDGRLRPFRSLLMERPSTTSHATTDVRSEVLSRMPVSTDWPKLPDTVAVSPLVSSLTAELTAKREAAAERMTQWLATKPAPPPEPPFRKGSRRPPRANGRDGRPRLNPEVRDLIRQRVAEQHAKQVEDNQAPQPDGANRTAPPGVSPDSVPPVPPVPRHTVRPVGDAESTESGSPFERQPRTLPPKPPARRQL